jgi:hypothetical protein
LAIDRGQIGRAAALAKNSLAIRREFGDPWHLLGAIEGAAAVMSVGQNEERATRVYGAAFALRSALGSPISGCDRAELERDLAVLRAALGEPAFARAWAEGARLSPDEAVSLALLVMTELAEKP